MNPINNYVEVLKKYAVFKGRASRSEFWWFVLANFIVSIILGIISSVIGDDYGILGVIYSLAVFIPGIAVGVRRLHDIGKSGWWTFICLIPLVGAIVLIVFYALPSQESDNEYGASLKKAKTATGYTPPTPPQIPNAQ